MLLEQDNILNCKRFWRQSQFHLDKTYHLEDRRDACSMKVHQPDLYHGGNAAIDEDSISPRPLIFPVFSYISQLVNFRW